MNHPLLKIKKKTELMDALEHQGMDPLSISDYRLVAHIFKTLLNNPDEAQQCIVKAIWDRDMGLNPMMLYEAGSSAFGRSLLRPHLSERAFFSLLISNGTLTELKRFFTTTPDYFQKSLHNENLASEESENKSASMDFVTSMYNEKNSCKSMDFNQLLVCESYGMQPDYSTMHHALRYSDFKHPGATLELLQRHRHTISTEQWDSLVTTLINTATHHNGKKDILTGDVYHLWGQLNVPGSYELPYYLACNVMTAKPDSPQNSIHYFDPANADLTKAQVHERWTQALNALGSGRTILSDLWNLFGSDIQPEVVIKSIQSQLANIVVHDTDNPLNDSWRANNCQSWPLSHPRYHLLIHNPLYLNTLLESLYENFSPEVSAVFYRYNQSFHTDVIKDFYAKKVVIENQHDKVALIMKEDAHSEPFKLLCSKTRMESLLPEDLEKPVVVRLKI